jgi:hypothetical protein
MKTTTFGFELSHIDTCGATLKTTHKNLQRWTALVSCTHNMSSDSTSVLHVRPNHKHTAFDIVEKLLFAKTCAVIHITESLSLHQVDRLKQMALFSGTELNFIGDTRIFNQEQRAMSA